MATKNPRITIMLTPRQHEVFKLISSTSGQSMSRLVTDFIEQAMPIFERMAVTFQHLNAERVRQNAGLVESLERAQESMEPFLLNAADQFDLFLREVDGVSIRSEASAPAAVSPPTNRGVTPSEVKRPKPLQHKVSSKISKNKVFSKVS